MNSLLNLFDISKKGIEKLLDKAMSIKEDPQTYSTTLKGKTLLMIFEKPSLRTRVSFEAAIQSLGGHAIVLEKQNLSLVTKESIEDTAKVSSRYVDILMARLFEHDELVKLSKNSSIPVINGLTNEFHPVQILCDLLTIKEKKGSFKNLKLCYLGDGNNNVTHSLILGCVHMGINISIGCPNEFQPKQEIINKAKNIAKVEINVTDDPKEAIKDADIVYTDSWMSYHTPEAEKETRISLFKPFQVNKKITKNAKKDFIFMNCLPAMRGYEQTSEIIDGKNSVVFDQAENRLHMQKAILLWCLK